MIDRLPALTADPPDATVLSAQVAGRDNRKAFRYLTAPPISEDDLKTLADAPLTSGALRADAAAAKRVRDVVVTILDRHRFPWVAAQRSPTDEERERAIIASATLAAAREIETERLGTQQHHQETAVKQVLRDAGFTEVPRRPIPIAADAPSAGTFCAETTLAGTRADVVARLPDQRVLAIECKVSNSSVNSYKRVVHDTGGKAAHWYRELGRAQIIPCAVLSGVFAPANLRQVQDDGDVFLFWQHRLSDLAEFVGRTSAP